MSTSSPPLLDPADVTPTVDQVALLERTRTVDSSGAEQLTFTDDTRPTDTECAAMIDQAVALVTGQLPSAISAYFYGAITECVALQAAILIEYSFYREQATAGAAAGYIAALNSMMANIQEAAGGAGRGARIDTPLQRSTMTDYDPWYAPPPPPWLPEAP